MLYMNELRPQVMRNYFITNQYARLRSPKLAMLSQIYIYLQLILQQASLILHANPQVACVSFFSCLSPRWESSCVPLGFVFDFVTCGETYLLLIFPGVQGQDRLCKHTLIHQQLDTWSPKPPDPSYILLNNNKYDIFL